MNKTESNCPICASPSPLFSADQLRSYFRCSCGLIFVDRLELLSPSEESVRYLEHENNEDDPRYREYLEKVTQVIVPLLGHRKSGLDFGCGASFLMEKILEEAGLEVDSFDLYFHPDVPIWQRRYDFIILSEVIEHLREPLEELSRLRKILKPQGMIFIKTKYHPNEENLFSNWYYKRDPTHIQFFNDSSMSELAHRLGLNPPEATSHHDVIYIMD